MTTTNLTPNQNPFIILLWVIAIALALYVLVSIFKPLALTACVYVLVSYGIAWLKGGREYVSSLSFIEILKWPLKLYKKNE
jgi:hypothetical protein